MPERGWRDPDLPDGVVRFPPEPRPAGRGRGVLAAVVALLAAAVAWAALRS